MRKITGILTNELKEFYGEEEVRRAEAFPVKTFRDLMQQVARLSYLNKDYLLFFRGQGANHVNKVGASSFYPSIFRGERTSKAELEIRFDVLAGASKRLVEAFSKSGIDGSSDIRKRRYIQWSILQHYEVCSTPLLDFTQSIRVASSFAFLNNSTDEAFIYVFGLPYLTNRISINSEHDLVNIRLLSICPPDALRPYYQEGYLAGTDELTIDFDSKEEFDFNSRLIAKFKIPNNNSFWNKGFSAIPEIALYPRNDRIQKLCEELGKELGTEDDPGQLGLMLQAWVRLESRLLDLARAKNENVRSVLEALRVLQNSQDLLDRKMFYQIDQIRKIRNIAVHTPDKARPGEFSATRIEMDKLTEELKKISDSRIQKKQ